MVLDIREAISGSANWTRFLNDPMCIKTDKGS